MHHTYQDNRAGTYKKGGHCAGRKRRQVDFGILVLPAPYELIQIVCPEASPRQTTVSTTPDVKQRERLAGGLHTPEVSEADIREQPPLTVPFAKLQ